MSREDRLQMFRDAAAEGLPAEKPRAAEPEGGAGHCIFGSPSRTCRRKVACRRLDAVVRSVPRERCASCPERIERLSISAIFTAFNEGEQVRQTLESAAASVNDAELQIILIDDASTDGSCDGRDDWNLGDATLTYIRHDEPWGVGRSRNAGAAAATGHVLSFHDAHMRFKPGGLEALAHKALTTEAVICSSCCHFNQQKPGYHGCCVFWNRECGLQPKWRLAVPEQPFGRVPGMMGAGYVMSRDTIDRLSEPTGQLWEDTAGLWGHSEEALDVKAFLLDVPILASRDEWISHLFKKANPIAKAGKQKWRNITRAMGLLLPPEVFDLRFRAWCENRLGQKEVARILQGIQPVPVDTWKRPVSEIWTHLCGKGATVAERHPDHEWMDEVEAAARALPAGARVLCWRPGEALLRLRDLAPDAAIHAIELDGHRYRNWAEICKATEIKLEQISLDKDYVERPRLWADRDASPYDLVLVGGELQGECRAVAEGLVRPGGRIIMHPAADRRQIEHEQIKKEKKRIEHQLKNRAKQRRASGHARAQTAAPAVPQQPPVGPSAGGASSRADGAAPLVTVLLLNWGRPDNIGPILDRLAAQTVPLTVYVWNNGNPLLFHQDGGEGVPLEEHPLVGLHLQSSVNERCWPRWLLAGLATTPYVCTHDDDLLLGDVRVLEDAVEAHRTKCPDGVVGFFGVERIDGRPFRAWRHINGTKNQQDRRVDFVKGRFMLLRRELLQRVPLVNPPFDQVPPTERLGDDINVCLSITGGRAGGCLIPGELGKRWRELKTQYKGRALCTKRGHYERRGEVFERLRAWQGLQRETQEILEVRT